MSTFSEDPLSALLSKVRIFLFYLIVFVVLVCFYHLSAVASYASLSSAHDSFVLFMSLHCSMPGWQYILQTLSAWQLSELRTMGHL